MHWARIIRDGDNGEWTAVMHADGTTSEVKVSLEGDTVHVAIAAARGKKVYIHGDGEVT